MFSKIKNYITENTGILIRLDDIAENMNWDLMKKLELLFEKHAIKPVLGVIPKNKDTDLLAYPKKDDFWQKIREWSSRGWEISMHGCTHVYETNSGKKDYFGYGGNSEFCEKSLENQIIKTLEDNNLTPKAIIAVNLFGQLCDYDSIKKIAKKYNLFLIEDAAQSFGASYKGQKSCSFGDVAATSFYPAKPLGCYGDGGAIFTNNTDISKIYRSIRVHGEGKDKYDNVRIGLNSRLDTLQAVVLLKKLEIFDEELELRNQLADYYNDNLKEYVEIPHIEKDNISSWAQYSIRVEEDRKRLIKILNDNNVPTAIFYEKPFNSLDIYKNLSSNNYNISEQTSNTIFSIPMHPYLSRSDQNKIISIIKNGI